MLRRAQITGMLVTALLTCAAPASAASPVSDQYQSAAPPLIAAKPKAKTGSPASAGQRANAPVAAAAPSGRPPTPGASATPAATPREPRSAPAALRVSRDGDANVQQPLSSAGSTLPLIALGALAALALGLAAAAVARGRRSPATP